MRNICLGAMLAGLALSGSGSKESLREDVVSCSAYLNALNVEIMRGNQAFLGRVMERLVKTDAADADEQRSILGRKLADLGAGAARYRSDLDPARLSVIVEKERKTAQDQVSQGRDAQAASRIKDCVSTWERLGKS